MPLTTSIFFCCISLYIFFLLPRMLPRLHWKTERIVWERINEQGCGGKGSVIYNHITNYKGVNYLLDLWNIYYNSAERDKCGTKSFSVTRVKENICITDKPRRWDILLFKIGLKFLKKNIRYSAVVSKLARN